MPQVPTYDNFQATPQALPAARLNAPDVPDVAGRWLRDTGQTLQRVGQGVGQIALDLQEQANQTRVNNAMNQAVAARSKLTYDPNEGFTHLRGEAALANTLDGKSPGDAYIEKYRQRLDELASGLGNPVQRQLFSQQADRLLQQFSESVTQHTAREFTSFQISTAQGAQEVSHQQVALGWDDAQKVSQGLNAIKASVYDEGQVRGWSALQTQAVMVEHLSKAHSSVLAAATDAGKLDYAREYFKQAQAEMTPGARLQAQKILDAGDFEARTQNAADTLYAQHGGDTAAALAAARATLSGKDEDAVVTRIKTLDAERVTLRERAQRDAADQAWRAYAQSGTLGRVPPSVLAAMDGRDLEALRRTARVDAEARSARTEAKTDIGMYYDLTKDALNDPTFKTKDLRVYFDKLSPGDRKHFIELQAKLNAPEKAAEVVTVVQQIDAMAEQFKGKEAGLFTREAQAALFAARQQKGRDLDQAERQDVLDSLVLRGKTPGSWSTVPRFKATAEGVPFEPKFTDKDVREATDWLRKKGVQNPTREQVETAIKKAYRID